MLSIMVLEIHEVWAIMLVFSCLFSVISGYSQLFLVIPGYFRLFPVISQFNMKLYKYKF